MVLSSNNQWTYVYFQNSPNIHQLKDHDIDLQKGVVYKNVYKLYLTPKQISFLQKNEALLTPIDPNSKLINITKISNSKQLHVKGEFNQISPKNKSFYTIISYSEDHLIIETKDPIKSSKYFSSLPEVEFISSYEPPTSANNIASGFTQKNTADLITDTHGNIIAPRYLESKGLTGKNQAVALVDDSLDYYHSHFYDPSVNMTFNKFIPNHRKISYYYNFFETEESLYKNFMPNKSHGTHVSGTIAGKSLNENDKINSYNGVAPDSKLMYLGLFDENFNALMANTSKLVEIIQAGNFHIFTNSWGSFSSLDIREFQYLFDKIIYEDNVGESCLILFCAGNEGKNGFYTIRSPGNSKNVLTVGAASKVFDYQNFKIIITNEEGKRVKVFRQDPQPYSAGEFNIVNMKFYLSNCSDFSMPKMSKKFLYFDINDLNKIKSDFSEVLAQIQNYDINGLVFDIKFKEFNDYSSYFPNPDPGLVFFTNNPTVLKSDVGKYIIINYTYDSLIGKQNSQISKSFYSSIGPTHFGVIKPDVMAPGSFVTSSKSKQIIDPNHGSKDDYLNNLFIADGTSMATPNAAGAAALISQYFDDYKYLNEKVNINSLLLKSLLITSASKSDGSYTPDNFVGHGLIDISTVLPFEDDNFGLRFSNIIKMSTGQMHHKGQIKITKNTTSLKIVLCSHDKPLSIESIIPIYFDLDLIVISPTKKIYIGNNRINDTEHYTLNEKIIIPTTELEIGEYEIHVISNIEITENISYIITTIGPFEQNDINSNPKFIEMQNTNKCISTKNSNGCNKGKLICKNGFTGQLCNIEFQEFPSYITSSSTILPENSEFIMQPNTLKFFKVSKYSNYDELLVVLFSNQYNNQYSFLWEMGKPENYIPALSQNAYQCITSQNAYQCITSQNVFSIENEPITTNASQENYFFISNNYPYSSTFFAAVLNKPNENDPLCFCNNNDCSNKEICKLQNTYSTISVLYGIFYYCHDRVIYIDKDIEIPSTLLIIEKPTFELLKNNNTNSKHLVTFMNCVSSASTSNYYLSINNLRIKFAETSQVSSNIIPFEYLELKNITFEDNNNFILSIKNLITDYGII